MVKTVAIIGAGCSGITAIKSCLDEGLSPTCYERRDTIGGLWNYDDDDTVDGQASVMRSTSINTDKEMTSYSDFPIPKEYPIFMHNRYVKQYFEMYARHFNLYEKIEFKTEIISIKRASDFAKTGKWELVIKSHNSGEVKTVIYDAVMLCTGHHAKRNIPQFDGMDQFKGQILHSHGYKNPRGFENKRVVVVGIGNSAVDIAVELSRAASQVYVSTRRGAWIFNRVATNGLPIGLLMTNRYSVFKAKFQSPRKMEAAVMKQLNERFDHKLYRLEPKHGPFSQHPTVCDELPNRIAAGAIIVKNNIKRFTEAGVEFEDGSVEDNIDVVIMATGYQIGFPYVEKDVLDIKDNKVDLYKFMFVPDLEHQTLCVIGCIQPLGSIIPVAEIQSRAAARVFKKEAVLPPSSEMWKNIRTNQAINKVRFVTSQRHTIEVDFIRYMDEMAEIVGCKPNLWRLFFTDTRLWYECFFGPCTAYHYRLMGPNAWDGAREAIFTTMERTVYSLKTRTLDQTATQKQNRKIRVVLLVGAAIVGYVILAKKHPSVLERIHFHVGPSRFLHRLTHR